MILKITIILTLLLHHQIALTKEIEDELIFVQAIWRHGDRAPSKLPYPNDVHNEDKWDNGWGQLTKKGKYQMMELGSWFKKRYINSFVNATYKSKEVYIRSSDIDRTLISAQSFIFGMYSNQKHSGHKLPTQAVPIHAPATGDNDPLLRPDNFECPEYDKKVKNINEHLYDELMGNYSDIIPFLKNHTGFKGDFKLKDIGSICNVKIEMIHNFNQPSWIFSEWPQHHNKTTLDIVCDIKRQLRLSDFQNSELGKLRGGYLLDNWLENARKIIHHPDEEHKKMILYSSHAETILALRSAFNVYPDDITPYATALIMELYKTDNSTYYVKLYLKSHNKPLEELQIPGCEHKCNFDTLTKLYVDVEIDSRKELYRECGLEYCEMTGGVVFDYAD
uniref:Histidine acid phosphatase family protein n=1 Tax=Strongyloides venezuelensis TaxID=75913 RepID=A0A0K0FF07_STRVS